MDLHGPSRRSGYRQSMSRLLLLAATVAVFLACSAPAEASPYVRYGLQDDAWLVYGPGTLDERIAELDRIGVDLVRFTINWHEVEKVRGTRGLGERRRGARRSARPRHRARRDALRHARAGRTAAVLRTGRRPRARPSRRSPPRPRSAIRGSSCGSIWNEPNQRRWLRPTTPQTYVTKLLNPAYAAIHKATRARRSAAA